MKLGKIDFCKIKKITAIEITTISLVLIALGIYFAPRFMTEKEVMLAAKIKSDNAIYVSKALEMFAANKNIKPSEVAQAVSDELNKTAKNPYDKNKQAYTFDSECKGCNSVEYDDKLTMIVLTTYDKKGDLIARTVVRPPSFVTYSKADDDKKIKSKKKN